MELTLPSGHIVLIDDEDYELVKGYNWHIQKGYAMAETGSRELGTRKTYCMHRIIFRAKEGQLIDHKNRNKLDNRKFNLRECNKSTNGMNRGKQVNNKSGYKGVSWEKRFDRWRVVITKMRKQKHVGTFKTLEAAQAAYKRAAKEIHGEFAAF